MNDMLQYKNYIAPIHFSSTDKVFYGKVGGIDDLVSFEGVSVEDLENAFHEAIEDYIETCNEIGNRAK